VREAALYGLANLDEDKALEALPSVLQEEQHPDLRRTAIYALGNIGDDRVVPLLQEVAEREGESTRVRTAAVQVLGNIGTPKAQEALLRILQNRKPDDNR
jgi:HEAT repeat protein